MEAPSLELARRCAHEAAEEAGVTLVTPDSAPLLRSIVYLAVAAQSSLSLDTARSLSSAYVPALAVDVAEVLKAMTGLNVPVDRPFAIIGGTPWMQRDVLPGIAAHELSHNRRDEATRRTAGVITSVLWGLSYLTHPMVRAWEESTCFQCDVTSAVILGGVSPDDAARGATDALKRYYRLDDRSAILAKDACVSAGRSLAAKQLPGVDTTMHSMLRRLVRGGWTPPAEYAEAIGV